MSQGEEKTLSYSELLLGGSMEAILEAAENDTPWITESRFVNEVLPLLERPFYHSSLTQYVNYLRISNDRPGELTSELRVVSDSDHNQILFKVPAIIQTTGVTLPASGAPTTDATLKTIYSQAERGVDVNPMVAQFMQAVTAKPDMVTKLLNPLRDILARYGRNIDLSDENNQIGIVEATKTTAAAPVEQTGTDSFTGEYE